MFLVQHTLHVLKLGKELNTLSPVEIKVTAIGETEFHPRINIVHRITKGFTAQALQISVNAFTQ